MDSTKEALTALSSLHCSMRQRLITSCSGSASLFPLRSSPHPENGRKPYAGPPFRRPDSADLPPSR
ncbi:hypothetical protein EC2867750_5240 [Escherichia coli 2867750]|nr:hypothetical protein EC2867750_5240 [Escherichia coli 2867750]